MNIIKKINKFLSVSLALTNFMFQYDKSFVYAMKPVKLGDVQGKEISKVRNLLYSNIKAKVILKNLKIINSIADNIINSAGFIN